MTEDEFQAMKRELAAGECEDEDEQEELDRYYAALDAISTQSWAEKAHAHIQDGGAAGELAQIVSTIMQLADQALRPQIMPSTHAATPNVADFPKPLLP